MNLSVQSVCKTLAFATSIVALSSTTSAFALSPVTPQQIEKLPAQPLEDVVNVRLQPVKNDNTAFAITWGGDVATEMAVVDGIFKQEGFDSFKLTCENDFAKQVQACLDGETPYLRGTLGMIATAAPVFQKAGTGLVVAAQKTWSTGGDAIVVRGDIKTVADLKGKTIVCQRYGPHVDYLMALLKGAELTSKDVNIIWVNDLTLPETDNGKITDPVSAFESDSSIDAAMCIIPDALVLTGKEGVKGADILSTTKTNAKVIADVYAVRLDYFEANRDKVQAFTRSVLRGQEALQKLNSNKKSQQAKYRQVLSSASKLVWGSAEMTSDTEALMADCTFVGHGGNVAFFTGQGTTRNLEKMSEQIQKALLDVGMISGRAPIGNPSWDFNALGRGLTSTGIADATPAFDSNRAQRAVQERIETELDSWEDAATLFVREVYFPPKSTDFDASSYEMMYAEIVELAQTNSGALIVIEGHADPLGILKAKKEGKSQTEIGMIKQRVKSLSLERAKSVNKAFFAYCAARGLRIDQSQFVAVGIGVDSPKHFPVRTKEQWNENRRVAFRVKNVEAELSEFEFIDIDSK